MATERERAERMVDFGMEEAAITFDLGPPPTEEEIAAVAKELEELKEEEE